MPFLPEISAWFKDNDLVIKSIATIAAPGGIWFWIDKFKNRIRIKIRRLGLPHRDTSLRGITFEAENVSSTLTSFEPEFTLVGYSPERKKLTYTFRFDGTDRQLPSHVSKQFLGWHNHAENRILLFLWFMTFRFPLSRGRHAKVRIRNAKFEPVGFMQFHWERLLFLCFGKVPE
jgi:hypothetical protein